MMISTQEFSRLVGISKQKARRALKLCAKGQTWRGTKLTVRLVPSRGGSSGLAYEVARDSIPSCVLALSETPLSSVSETAQSIAPAPLEPSQPMHAASVTAVSLSSVSKLPNSRATKDQNYKPVVLMQKLPRSRVTGDGKMAEWRLALVQQVLQTTSPRTEERSTRTLEVAQAVTRNWLDRPVTVSDRTLRDWIARYEVKGMEGLMRKAPKNAGKRRVLMSRQWDRAMRDAGLGGADIADLVAVIRKRVRSEWASGTPSWPTVQLNALPTVVDIACKAVNSLAILTP